MLSYSHAPEGYACPICQVVAGVDHTDGWTTQREIVLRNQVVVAWINARWWPGNHGAVVLCPVQHYENIYELPPALGAHLQAAARTIALAMKECYGCDGISTRQHNEPAGDQKAWHYHLHVFPRYEGDRLYERHLEVARFPIETRVAFAERLRPYVDRLLTMEQTPG